MLASILGTECTVSCDLCGASVGVNSGTDDHDHWSAENALYPFTYQSYHWHSAQSRTKIVDSRKIES
jgi:hypothetical protein